MRAKHKTLKKRSYEKNIPFTDINELHYVMFKTRNL